LGNVETNKMKKLIFSFWKYIGFRLTTVTRYKLHSPFLYKLATEAIHGKSDKYIDRLYRQLYQKFAFNSSTTEVVEFNIKKNTKLYSSEVKSIRSIFKQSAISSKKAQVLARLLVLFKPENIIEFGTSLGVSASIFAQASHDSKIYSIEGCSGLASIAQANFDELGFGNIEIQIGHFNHVVNPVLNKIKKVDFVFYDGSDDYKTAINAFESCLPYIGNDGVFIMNSIYRSRAMNKAWDYIKKHNDSIVCIDLFQMGIILFRKEMSKQEIKYLF
jgi:predicted O-methyltransferase YrrM